MAFDLFRGITRRNWARETNPLLTVPVPGVVIKSPGAQALEAARDFDSRVRVRPTAGGATISTKWKWG